MMWCMEMGGVVVVICSYTPKDFTGTVRVLKGLWRSVGCAALSERPSPFSTTHPNKMIMCISHQSRSEHPFHPSRPPANRKPQMAQPNPLLNQTPYRMVGASV